MNIITVYYNFSNYESRYQISKKCTDLFAKIKNINFYIVELAYDSQKFKLTDVNNKNHLQLKCLYPFWHKENLINIGIDKLLPKDWKYVAWIDCNISFENSDFIEKTLSKLQNELYMYDFVQMFSTIKYFDHDELTYNTYESFMYSVEKNDYNPTSKPGGAWACTRNGYEKIGKLYDYSLCESDCILAHALGLKRNYHNNPKKIYPYVNNVEKYVNNIIEKQLKVSYIDNIAMYYWHGNQENRKYHLFRHNMITKVKYDTTYFTYDNDGVVIPSEICPQNVIDEFKKYFLSREEDSDAF